MSDEPRTEESGPVSATLDEHGTTEATMAAVEALAKKLVQTVEIKDVGPCKKYIKVAVDRMSIDGRLNEQYSKLVVDSNVSGFRPGKAPRKLVERRFQKDVEDQVKAELLLASLEQLAEEHDIAPLSAPNLDPFKIELPKDGPFVYEFEVEVRPEFDVPNYKGLKIRRPVRTFSDDDVAVEERRLLAPYGQVIPKPEGNAQIGDIVVADVTSKDGDRVLSEMKETPIRVDPRLAFKDGVAPRFGKQITGANAGDTRIVDVKLSDTVADATLSGKTVHAHFHIKEVKALKLPELSHHFLHNFGVHTPEQLHELIHVLLKRRLESQQRQKARDQVLGQIAVSNWDLPRDLLIRQARKSLARKAMEMRSDGIPEKEIESRMRLMQQDILNTTALALKEHFVLQKIAELEKIDINEDDLEDEIDRIADQNDESPRKVRARLEKDDLMDALAAEIIERKALDLILDSAEYDDYPQEQDEGAVGEIEQQTVPGEMKDLTKELPAEEDAAVTTAE